MSATARTAGGIERIRVAREIGVDDLALGIGWRLGRFAADGYVIAFAKDCGKVVGGGGGVLADEDEV